MNADIYKRRLMDLRAQLSAEVLRDEASGRGQTLDVAADTGDASVADESESEDFTDAERDSATLQEVEAALRRIEDGTYGRCVVDGKPIEAKRLDAEPWTRYCIEHQRQREQGSRPAPTL